MTTIYFSAPQPTIELAQSLYEPAVFNPAGVFQTPDGFVLALLRDMNWPPQGAAEAIKRATGYSMVSCCDPLLSVWHSYPFQKPVAPDGANVPREDDIERRLAALEAAAAPAIANRAWMDEIERRLDDLVLRAVSETTHVALLKRVDALETKNASAAVHLNQVPLAVKRIDELEQMLQAVIKDCVAIEKRLDTPQSNAQPPSAVEALRQIANILVHDAYGSRKSWIEIALTCINIAKKALEDAPPPPRPGHRHDGGHWIKCPFCVDDKLGMCSACDGTRRIWEMPREDDE